MFYAALLSWVKPERGASILDVGCGTGHLLREMAARLEISGFGIDSEPNMIEIAKQQCPEMTIQGSACERTTFADSLMGIAGKFFTSKEIASGFGAFGFELAGIYLRGIVQVVELQRQHDARSS